MTFADQITAIDSCVAYHNGPNYTVEVDLVMDGETPLRVAHDVCVGVLLSLPACPLAFPRAHARDGPRPADSIAPPSSRPHTHSSQALQDKLEELPQVDRAFVHVDHETSHKPEHRKTK